MLSLKDGRIQCRVKITGHIRGVPWEYTDPIDSDGSQYIWPPDDEGNRDASEYWWSQGNFACDCNRIDYTGATQESHPELFEWIEEEKRWAVTCGHVIRITSIIPVEDGLPELWLNER